MILSAIIGHLILPTNNFHHDFNKPSGVPIVQQRRVVSSPETFELTNNPATDQRKVIQQLNACLQEPNTIFRLQEFQLLTSAGKVDSTNLQSLEIKLMGNKFELSFNKGGFEQFTAEEVPFSIGTTWMRSSLGLDSTSYRPYVGLTTECSSKTTN